MSRHFFILGSNPVLSIAEIIALLPGREFTMTEMYKQAAVVDAIAGSTLDAKAMMERLGGTIKIGSIFAENEPLDPERLEALMLEKLSGRVADVGNATFGFSIYSLDAAQPAAAAASLAGKFRNVGMAVKRKLQLAGCAARWIKPQVGAALTSVVVEKNKVLIDGFEFVVLIKKDRMMVGTTTVVQPFEDFSNVDYGRPERDMVQGMLPPKLARMMINLIHVSKEIKDIALMDPFCGSGTILTEALRIGFRELYCSDLNKDAVANTQKNVDWVRAQGYVPTDATKKIGLVCSDARDLRAHLKPQSIDAIVSEPYLGPPRSGRESRSELQKTLAELQRLYYECLSSWRPLLRPGAPVVLAMPVFIHGMEKHGISAAEFAKVGFETESLLPSLILSRLGTKETKNRGLLYGRMDQKVWREIVRLRAIG